MTGGIISLAIVHHANQYLITDGYDNRDGLGQIVSRYEKVLDVHQRFKVPVNINLSGTLLEAIAWHYPQFLEKVKNLRREGIIALVGGTYAENIMTLFPTDFNIRQLNELLWLYQRHLDCPPEEVMACWVPERVWDTEKLAPALTSRLSNGGYRYIIIDDRILLPAGKSYQDSPRAIFDAYFPHKQYYAGPLPHCPPYRSPTAEDECGYTGCPYFDELHQIYRIKDGNGLSVIPISTALRYLAPPFSQEQWTGLDELKQKVATNNGSASNAVLVYGDDLEKVAGSGPWDPRGPEKYEDFLKWVASQNQIKPMTLSRPEFGPCSERQLEPGTYYELAHAWGAGEDYQGWAQSAGITGQLNASRQEVEAAEPSADDRLLGLAWKHLLASGYETAWHDTTANGSTVTPWAKALASHSRSSIVITAAARWLASRRPDSPVEPYAEALDIDRDGEAEVILYNQHLFAVVSPLCGGRLVYLFAGMPNGGVLNIGNPTDDWNWQEELNRYMDRPANHPGGLADVGFEHDRYQVTSLLSNADFAMVRLSNAEKGSVISGAEKIITLTAGGTALSVSYRLPEGVTDFSSATCLSPDYYRLLRDGTAALSAYDGEGWRGFRNGDAAVWLALASGEPVEWSKPEVPKVGHGMNLRLNAHTNRFHLLIGCGDTDAQHCRQLQDDARNAAESRSPDLTGAG